MKEHVLRGLALILIFFSYFAWRLNMTGFNPVIYVFVLAGAIALGLIIKMYCKEQKTDKKMKQDRMIFIGISVLFLAAVLIRILFLS